MVFNSFSSVPLRLSPFSRSNFARSLHSTLSLLLYHRWRYFPMISLFSTSHLSTTYFLIAFQSLFSLLYHTFTYLVSHSTTSIYLSLHPLSTPHSLILLLHSLPSKNSQKRHITLSPAGNGSPYL